jgi:hypothetical protein
MEANALNTLLLQWEKLGYRKTIKVAIAQRHSQAGCDGHDIKAIELPCLLDANPVVRGAIAREGITDWH